MAEARQLGAYTGPPLHTAFPGLLTTAGPDACAAKRQNAGTRCAGESRRYGAL